MPEATQISFSHRELAETLVKSADIHEGYWGIYVEFGFSATNIQGPDGNLVPATVVPVTKIGIQRFPEANNLTVDAAVVNPLPKSRRTSKQTEKE